MRPEEISIYADIRLNKVLKDHRQWTYGFVFGTVEAIARQCGVKINDLGTCKEFTAPKNRLQLFVEKLHFSKTSYSSKKF